MSLVLYDYNLNSHFSAVNAERIECDIYFDGCNTIIYGASTLIACLHRGRPYCNLWKCPDGEEPINPYDPVTGNKVCGTDTYVIHKGCICSYNYSYRDKDSMKCLKVCPTIK